MKKIKKFLINKIIKPIKERIDTPLGLDELAILYIYGVLVGIGIIVLVCGVLIGKFLWR